MQQDLEYDAPYANAGSAIRYVKILPDGTMWVSNGHYETRVNYCPFTGTPAPTQMSVRSRTRVDTFGGDHPYKQYLDVVGKPEYIY